MKWCWISETEGGTYADEDNNSTLYETNVDTTFYHLPIHVGRRNPFINHEIWELLELAAGSSDPTYLKRKTKFTPDISLSGDVVDHSMLHMLTGKVETADDTPGASYYTHEYDIAHTPHTTRPSLGLLMKCANAGTGNDLLLFFGGVKHNHYHESLDFRGEAAQNMQGTLDFQIGYMIAGTDLTTWPSYPVKVPFNRAHLTTKTFNDGDAAINANIVGYELDISNDKRFKWSGGSYYPAGIYAPNSRTHNLTLTVEDYALNVAGIYRDNPTTANNHDFQFKFVRTTNQDEWHITHTNCLYKFQGYEWGDQLLTKVGVKYNAEEASPVYKLTEINNLDDNRYET
jgi:hypothetical protein